LDDGRYVPAFDLVDFKIDIPRDQIKLVLNGNLVTKFGDSFNSLFLSEIIDHISK
jgi:hypothetical protein